MNSDQEKTKALLGSLAGAVISAIRSGSADGRKRLVAALNEMNANMPGISEDTAQAKEFLLALISLLEGNPVSPGGLSGAYAGLYAGIVEKALAPDAGSARTGQGQGVKEFLTQLSATAVLVMRTGMAEDKKGLALKLREIGEGMPGDEGKFVLALADLLEGRPVDAGSLPGVYAGFFTKIVERIEK